MVYITPIHSNGILTQITGGGYTEDYGVAAGADAAKWTGRSPIWVREKFRTDFGTGGGVTQVKVMQIVIDGNLPVLQGDNLIFEFAGQTGITREVRDMTREMLNSTPFGFVIDVAPL